MVLELEEQLEGMRRDLTRMAERMELLEANVARDMRRMAHEVSQIVPARDHRSLGDLWSEYRQRTKSANRRPIEMGPVPQ
jgi:predicted nuclease with TOPRIM domain